ncbi:MAG: hypothetical protein NC548_34055 [Lachnospiraceae bacterium]|nr:hypothetical protein [Lachnospiraceae bacterium]
MNRLEIINELSNIINNTEYTFYGLRAEEKVYSPYEYTEISHRLTQYQMFDLAGNPLYTRIDDGTYEGFYVAEELNGTCCIDLFMDSWEDPNIIRAVESVLKYAGSYITVIAGYMYEVGYGVDEIIIADAICIKQFNRTDF